MSEESVLDPCTAGCRRCGETDPGRRHGTCQGRPVSHDWLTLEFAICRSETESVETRGLGLSSALSLGCKGGSTPRKVEFGLSRTAGYHSTFTTVDHARAWIDALGLVGVDIRQVEFPRSIDRMRIVWPESAVASEVRP